MHHDDIIVNQRKESRLAIWAVYMGTGAAATIGS